MTHLLLLTQSSRYICNKSLELADLAEVGSHITQRTSYTTCYPNLERARCTTLVAMANTPAHNTSKHSVNVNDTDGSLWTYMVEHSMRPQTELAELQKVSLQHPRSLMVSPPDSVPVLQMLVHLTQAKRIVEVGVFTGYTTLAMALALRPGGKLIACDITDEYPSIGKPFWERAGVADKVDLRIAPALETLDDLLATEGEGSVDLGFIDADKSNYGGYYERLLKLLRPGGVIAVDNVLWGGSVIDPTKQDDDTKVIRALNDKIFKDDRVHICMLSNSDGITIVMKK